MSGVRRLFCVSAVLALGGLSGKALPQVAATPDQAAPAQAALAEVVVTGSRLETGFSSPQPVTMMSTSQLQAIAPNSIFFSAS